MTILPIKKDRIRIEITTGMGNALSVDRRREQGYPGPGSTESSITKGLRGVTT